MENKCENCHGEGLVGQGEQPWLRQGRTETCKKCGGTGKLVESAGANLSAPTPRTTQPVQPNITAPTPDTTEGGEKKEGDIPTPPTGDQSIPGAVDEPNLTPSDIEPAIDETLDDTPIQDATM